LSLQKVFPSVVVLEQMIYNNGIGAASLVIHPLLGSVRADGRHDARCASGEKSFSSGWEELPKLHDHPDGLMCADAGAACHLLVAMLDHCKKTVTFRLAPAKLQRETLLSLLVREAEVKRF
jgi:hypothetical protein